MKAIFCRKKYASGHWLFSARCLSSRTCLDEFIRERVYVSERMFTVLQVLSW